MRHRFAYRQVCLHLPGGGGGFGITRMISSTSTIFWFKLRA